MFLNWDITFGRTWPRDTRSSDPESDIVCRRGTRYKLCITNPCCDERASDHAEPVRPPAYHWQTLCALH